MVDIVFLELKIVVKQLTAPLQIFSPNFETEQWDCIAEVYITVERVSRYVLIILFEKKTDCRISVKPKSFWRETKTFFKRAFFLGTLLKLTVEGS